MRRHHHALLILAIATLSGPAAAVGFGRSQPTATLGQALDFVVAVRLDAGEVLLPECVSAEVIVGDTALARGAIGASLESNGGAPQVRVRTLVPVDEPVVLVTVNLGCESRVSRRFTLFADPLGMNPLMPAVAEVPSAVQAQPTPPAAPASAPSPAAADAARTPPPPAPATRQSKLLSAAADAAKPAPRPPRKAVVTKAAAVSAGGDVARPRLRLDDPVISAAAAVAAAASAAEREAALKLAEQTAIAAQAAASQATDRMAAMEKDLAALRKEAQASREMITRLSATLADADDRGRWAPMLLGAVLALTGLALWQAVKLRRERATRDADWWATAQKAGAAPVAGAAEPASASTAAPAPPPVSRSVDLALPAAAAAAAAIAASPREEVTIALAPARRSAPPAAPAPTPEEIAAQSLQRTVPMPVATTVHIAASSRDVSIEELLDLEQQAEFFIVLGQDDAAIDLLVGHLRSSGGTVPLPYLKLMEIYRRLGDEAAYERTRDRFNHRFNAVAPGWDADAQAVQRSLEEYPEVMAQIERNWPEPVDVMATLETQLFRSDGSEMFDLPAYREVLFLYSLARDLLEQSDRNGARVDVLLPLSDGTAYDSTQARPYLSDDLGSSGLDIVVEDRPTSPVDLDLDAGPKNAVSDFGFFEELRPPNKDR